MQLVNERYDKDTDEYVYDLDATKEEIITLDKLCAKYNKTVNEMVVYILQYMLDNPSFFDTMTEVADKV